MTTSLTPGVYRLNAPVMNPAPDRRTRHDWRLASYFPAGLYVVEPEVLHDETPRLAGALRIRRQRGSYSHQYFLVNVQGREDLPGPLALISEFKPEPESLDTFINGPDGPSQGDLADVLGELLAAGKLTLDDVKGAWVKAQAKERS